MVELAGRFVTFITNSLVLVGYVFVYNWLTNRQYRPNQSERQRYILDLYMVGLTTAFLVLFHTASVISIIQSHNGVGFGWTYINFQIATVLYALLRSRRPAIFTSIAVLLLIWFWWIPHTSNWLVYYAASMVLVAAAQWYSPTINRRAWYYFPFAIAFDLPFFATNYMSLGGINVGWLWQWATSIVLFIVIWLLQTRMDASRRRQQRLLHDARIDELTKVHNFRVFNEDLLAAYEECQQSGTYYAVYALDVDHFKEVNDRYGHLVGNRVLQTVAAELQRLTKTIEFPAQVYRTGGEEFSFLITGPHPDFKKACAICQSIHDHLCALTFDSDQGPFSITVSLGQDRSDTTDRNYLEAYRRADQYLYNSKRNGRNSITVAGVLISDGQPLAGA
ncbi:GGDEF domain-containing protein [Lacticaseibacillus pantheris]|uniref:GGDEF domain-containing protein n=1 Tax=Lacticaseibacillus pantheris TaxID=171523 RepID=UPI00265A5AB2|nr:GGDEF domain-containing protein [Lacticaseibacillus pantheris]WKF84990.1 GGDEF domain-containing protein [Lacticaseibacillus pantheris]